MIEMRHAAIDLDAADALCLAAIVLCYGVADIITTIAALSAGGFESNPLVVRAVQELGLVAGAISVKVAVIPVLIALVLSVWLTLSELEACADASIPEAVRFPARESIPLFIAGHGLYLAAGNTYVFLT